MATIDPAIDTLQSLNDTGFFYDGVWAGRAVRAGLSRRAASSRPLPMEEICFFVKAIDNSRLVRVLDPHSRRDCLKLVGFFASLFVLAVLYILPYLALRHSGYNVEDLKRQNLALGEENRALQVQESTLRDPQRIDTIARTRLGMKPALPEQMTWPDGARTPRQDGRELLARNLSRFAAERTR
jgi:cell division protein FtsL